MKKINEVGKLKPKKEGERSVFLGGNFPVLRSEKVLSKNLKNICIAVGGSATNPSHLGHKKIVEDVLQSGFFDKVVWIVSGGRKDKVFDVSPEDRVEMARLTFSDLFKEFGKEKFELELGDAYGENTPTICWLEKIRLKTGIEPVWFTGVDALVPRNDYGGKCEIEACWHDGERLIREWSFLVLPRSGYSHPRELHLPKNFFWLDREVNDEISSSKIRRLIAEGKKFEHLMSSKAAEYLKKKKLYGYKKR